MNATNYTVETRMYANSTAVGVGRKLHVVQQLRLALFSAIFIAVDADYHGYPNGPKDVGSLLEHRP